MADIFRTTFTFEEDEKILAAGRDNYPYNKWVPVSVEIPGKSEMQCVFRWRTYLLPLVLGSWTYVDDKKLVHCMNEMPGQWLRISKQLRKKVHHCQIRSNYLVRRSEWYNRPLSCCDECAEKRRNWLECSRDEGDITVIEKSGVNAVKRYVVVNVVILCIVLLCTFV